jgi:hypothetical protein
MAGMWERWGGGGEELGWKGWASPPMPQLERWGVASRDWQGACRRGAEDRGKPGREGAGEGGNKRGGRVQGGCRRDGTGEGGRDSAREGPGKAREGRTEERGGWRARQGEGSEDMSEGACKGGPRREGACQGGPGREGACKGE